MYIDPRDRGEHDRNDRRNRLARGAYHPDAMIKDARSQSRVHVAGSHYCCATIANKSVGRMGVHEL